MVPIGRPPQMLPAVLSSEEVASLLSCVKSLKHRTFLLTLYAAGLRLSEAAARTIPDIDTRSRSDKRTRHAYSLTFARFMFFLNRRRGIQCLRHPTILVGPPSVNFEEQWQKWIKAGRPEDKRPAKHKYVKGYERGLELYGQLASRLDNDKLMTSLRERGLIVVEGANDVMRLDCLDATAVGLCSNRATEEQIAKIDRFAQEYAQGRVTLMPDNDEGTAGFKELSWQLMERGLSVQLAWSSTMHDGQFAGKQPEDITPEEWIVIDAESRKIEESSEADRRS
jgi:5S rRNA maturation endonuclease (ribonuclease M5)